MLTQRNKEGLFTLDHSQTIGLTEEQTHNAGLPPGAGRGLFEAPTYTCSHCQAVVVMNPKRNRERAYCRGCDHLICDACGVLKAAGARCRTFAQLVDDLQEQAERQASSTLVLP
jgi:hypothetical protein